MRAAGRPGRYLGLGQIGEDERLIGLLMIRNEADILDAALASATRWFDRILVLDGTDEGPERIRTDEILASYPEVVFVARDADLPYDGPVRDGARQFLLAEARRLYGVDNWIGVLHGDEFWLRDPRPVIAAHNPLVDPCLRFRLVHFFLHTSDRERWSELAAKPLRERVTHFMWPGVPETRVFFDTGTRDYEVRRHSKVVPRTLRAGPLIDGYPLVQFNERDPEQVVARAEQRKASGWQQLHYDHIAEVEDVFVDSLHHPGQPEFGHEHPDPTRGRPEAYAQTDLPIGLDGERSQAHFVTNAADTPAGVQLLPAECNMLSGPSALLALIDQPGLRAHQWRHSVRGRLDDLDFADNSSLVARVLTSNRPSVGQRRTAVRDFTHEIADRRAGPAGWAFVVAPEELVALGAAFPNAVFPEERPGSRSDEGYPQPSGGPGS